MSTSSGDGTTVEVPIPGWTSPTWATTTDNDDAVLVHRAFCEPRNPEAATRQLRRTQEGGRAGYSKVQVGFDGARGVVRSAIRRW
jgi:hypothetical protein